MHVWFIRPCAYAFDAGSIHYEALEIETFWALLNGIEPIGEWHLTEWLKQGFTLVSDHHGFFSSWSEIFSFPFIKHFFYNMVFNSYFEETSDVVYWVTVKEHEGIEMPARGLCSSLQQFLKEHPGKVKQSDTYLHILFSYFPTCFDLLSTISRTRLPPEWPDLLMRAAKQM